MRNGPLLLKSFPAIRDAFNSPNNDIQTHLSNTPLIQIQSSLMSKSLPSYQPSFIHILIRTETFYGFLAVIPLWVKR